jgi:hypothetical protein
MGRKTARRSEKWEIKTRPDLINPKLDAVHGLSAEQIKRAYGTIDNLYARVAEILDDKGIPTTDRAAYRAYAEELWRHSSKYGGTTLVNMVFGSYSKYLLFGLSDEVLDEISGLVGVQTNTTDLLAKLGGGVPTPVSDPFEDNRVFWSCNNWCSDGQDYRRTPLNWYANSAAYPQFYTWAACLNAIGEDKFMRLWKRVNPNIPNLSWSNKRYLRVIARLYVSGPPPIDWLNKWTHIVMGWWDETDFVNNVRQHIGFKVKEGVLYATVADGTTESVVEIETFTEGNYVKTLEAKLENGAAKFWVDGVLKATITTNLPTGKDYSDYLFLAAVCSNVYEMENDIDIYDARAYSKP